MDPERLTNLDVEQLRQILREDVQQWLAEHTRRDEERFAQLRAGQQGIQRAVDDMNGRVGRMNAEIGFGLPEPDERDGRETLRARIHALENEDAVAKAIHDSYARTFARWQKMALFTFAGVAAVLGVLRFLGIGG